MISDDELREIFSLAWAAEWDRGLPEVLPDRSACERVARRAVADAAAKQALKDLSKWIVETPDIVSGMASYLNSWYQPESVLEWLQSEIQDRAASISTDKTGAGE